MKRLKPKPEAIEEAKQRLALAEGTQPGNEKVSGVTITIESHLVTVRALEAKLAEAKQQRDVAQLRNAELCTEFGAQRVSLDELLEILRREGGFRKPEDQATIARAKKAAGRSAVLGPTWVDRAIKT